MPADPSVQARQFKCQNCGAQLAFDAATGRLKCGHCGATQDVPATSGRIVEHDLFQNLGAAPRGLGTAVRVHRCRECGATVSFAEGVTATKCTFCGSPAVLEQAENAQALRPESLLPFAIDKRKANGFFEKWLSGLWFRPGDLKHMAKVLCGDAAR